MALLFGHLVSREVSHRSFGRLLIAQIKLTTHTEHIDDLHQAIEVNLGGRNDYTR